MIRFMRARQLLFGAVVSQFVRPHGFAGRLAGWEMALRPSNRKRNRWAVGLLDVQPQDHILEIGFGPGLAIRELARRATDGFVLGIPTTPRSWFARRPSATGPLSSKVESTAIRIRHGPR